MKKQRKMMQIDSTKMEPGLEEIGVGQFVRHYESDEPNCRGLGAP